MNSVKIENGVTIITTVDAVGGLKNKTGCVGVTYYEKQGKYRSELTIKRKKYLLGFFSTLEDAKAIRKEAERQKAAGTFLEWFNKLEKHKWQKLTKEQRRSKQ